jgi:hypothetical protein
VSSIVRHVYVDGQKFDVFTGNPAVAASPRLSHTGGTPARTSSAGTDTTPDITETYLSELFVPAAVDITGLMLMNGSAVDGHVTVGLYDIRGTLIAKSGSISQSGVDAYQRIPLTASLVPGTYYVAAQFDSTDARFNTKTFGSFGAGKITGQTYGVLPSGLTMPTTFTADLGPIASLYAVAESAPPTGDWPWDDPDLIADFDLTTGQFWSGSLGQVTAAQAFTVTRSTVALAENADGLLEEAAANTLLTTDLGAACETSATCRVDFNGDLTNAAWTKVNCTIVKDLASPFADDRIAGCSINVTIDGDATVLQTMPVFSGDDESIPHGRFYLLTGQLDAGADVEITQDGVLWTSVKARMVADRWVQIPGVVQDVTLTTDPFGIRIKNGKAGNKIGWMLGNVERGYTQTTSVYTPGTATVNRTACTIQQKLENFPTIYDKKQITILAVCRPRMNPMPALDDTVHPVKGWTVMEMNNAYEIEGVGIGEFTPFGGAGQGSLMTVDSASVAAFDVEQRMLIGTGIGSRTDITHLGTGTGGAGTYRAYSDLYPNGQTTPVNIELQSRLKTAQGIALNAAQKPDDPVEPGISRIGCTFTAEPYMRDFGNDPQTEDVQTNGINALGVTVDLDPDVRKGAVVLNGDYEITHDDQFLAAPVFDNTIVINWGGQYLGGTDSGGFIGGEWIRGVIIARRLSDEDAARASLILEQRYT